MTPDALAERLLWEDDPQVRLDLIAQHRLGLPLVESLKALVDLHKDADAALALRAGERAVEAAAHAYEPKAQPLAAWALALGLTVQGSFAQAIGFYEAARSGFQALGFSEEAARAAVRQVQALAMMGDLAGALSLAQATRAAFWELGLLRDAATVGINSGIILSRLGRIPEAEAALLESLAQLEADGDELGAAKARSNLGQLYEQADRLPEAVHSLEAALAILQRHGQTQVVAGTSLNLALLYRKEGRLTKALELLDAARRAYGAAEAGPGAAFAGLEEARVYLDLNLLGEAQRLAKELVGVFASRGMKLEQAEALMTLGSAQAKAGHLAEAQQALGQAKGLWQDLGNPLQAALVEVYIANLLLQEGAGGDWPALEGAVVRSAEAAQGLAEMPSAKALALSVLAEALLELGNPQEASARLNEAALLLEGLKAPELRIRLEELRGRAALPADPAKAETHFKQAVELLEGVRAGLAVDDFKTAYLGDKLGAYAGLVDLLLDQRRVAEAFEYAERGKSRALLELLAGRGEQAAREDPQTQQLEQALKGAQAELSRRLLENGGLPERRRAAGVAEAEAHVSRLQRDLERMGGGSLSPVAPLGLEELRQALPPSTVLLEYFSTPQGLVAFVLDGHELRVVRGLGTGAEVVAALERLGFFLERVRCGEPFTGIYGEAVLQQSVDSWLRTLYRLLIEPLGLSLGGKRLVVVPHGVLHSVPFAALLGEGSYLLDQAEVSLAPSAALYAFCRARPRQVEGPLVAFGVLAEDIPQVQREVEAIAQMARGARSFVGQDATSANFFAQAEAAQVLHLATHAIFRPDNPMFSGLRLSDGWLAARDLYRLHLKAELVVLSACETGVSKQAGGDEVLGLARGFLYAGAPCLVASLWPVKDDVTAQLMTVFYRYLQHGVSVASALREAQKTVRAAHPNPYYWAAFGVTGDANRTVVI